MDDRVDELERGRAVALRQLSQRPRSEHELCSRLRRDGFSDSVVDRLCSRLRASGLLDDAALARQYIVTRSARLRHGPGRLLRDLERRGVSAEVARQAWDCAVAEGEVDPDRLLEKGLSALLRRHGPPRDRRAVARVYNALLRAGFRGAAIEQALEPYRDSVDSAGDATPEWGDP